MATADRNLVQPNGFVRCRISTGETVLGISWQGLTCEIARNAEQQTLPRERWMESRWSRLRLPDPELCHPRSQRVGVHVENYGGSVVTRDLP